MSAMEGHMKILGTTAAIVLGAAVLAGAGEPAILGIGSKVRVKVHKEPAAEGLVVATDPETLTLSLPSGATREIAWSKVKTMQVSGGRRSAGNGFLRGAGAGLASGALVGVMTGFVAGDDAACSECWFRLSAGEKATAGAVLLGGAGTIVGGVFGAVAPGERWQTVGERRLTLAPQADPSGKGAGLALRLAF
jgi:hypothetical protein